MPWYRKKPIIVKARQLKEVTLIDTLEGTMRGEVGDWLIIGVNGEMYPCKDEIFRKTYEPVEEEEQAHGRQTQDEHTERSTLEGE